MLFQYIYICTCTKHKKKLEHKINSDFGNWSVHWFPIFKQQLLVKFPSHYSTITSTNLEGASGGVMVNKLD